MELYALAQQRQMLACMGIDLWVAKDVSDLQTVDNVLYRDSTIVTGSLLPVVSEESPAASTVLDPALEDVETQANLVEPQPKVVAKAVDHLQVSADVTPAAEVEIAAFELQAVVLPNCILILQATDLTVEQQQLWSNIQAAQIGRSYHLKWPFALAQFQDGRGVSAYIQGFLAALQQEHRLISLGALPVLFDGHILQLSNLQEMLDQPLLKRQLWQHMQEKA